jgi:hypothetical protein
LLVNIIACSMVLYFACLSPFRYSIKCLIMEYAPIVYPYSNTIFWSFCKN